MRTTGFAGIGENGQQLAQPVCRFVTNVIAALNWHYLRPEKGQIIGLSGAGCGRVLVYIR
jgi:hypothetical protein